MKRIAAALSLTLLFGTSCGAEPTPAGSRMREGQVRLEDGRWHRCMWASLGHSFI